MRTRLEAPAAEPFSTDGTSVALSGVGRVYPPRSRAGRPTEAIRDVTLSAGEGDVLAIVGPSGCGKSTLLELACGLQEPDGGAVEIGGESAASARLARCAYMAQRDLLLPWRDALANAALALECRGLGRREARERAAPLFARFGLDGFERSRPAQLSGGMRQRVAFLRTLLAGRPVLALDEPFAALDAITRGEMQEWLAAALEAEPRTVLCVTHDVEEALFLGDRVVVLSERPGRVRAQITVDLPRPRPRRVTITDPRFVELRERALEALGS
jgi:NitT/TauT family transport system ATP-binding protein